MAVVDAAAQSRPRRLRRLRRFAIVLVALVLCTAIAYTFFGPVLLARVVHARLAPYASGVLSVESAFLKQLRNVVIEGLEITDPEQGNLVRVRRITIRGAIPALLTADGIPEEVRIEGAKLACVREHDGAWSVQLPLRLPPRPRIPTIRFLDSVLILPGGHSYALTECRLVQGEVDGEVLVRAVLKRGAETVHVQGQFHRMRGSARFEIYARQLELPHPVLFRLPMVRERLEESGVACEGRASLRVVAAHEPDQPLKRGWTVECQLVLRDALLHLAGVPLPVSELGGVVEYSGGAVVLRDVQGMLGTGRLRASGSLGEHTRIELHVAGLRLRDCLGERARQLSRWCDLTVDGVVDIKGGRNPETWRGVLEGHVSGPPLSGKDVTVRVALQEGTVRLDRAELPWAGGRVLVWGTGKLETGALEGGLLLEGVRLDALPLPEAASVPVNAVCQADIAWKVPLRAVGDIDAWEFRGSIRLDNIETPEQYVGRIEGALEKPVGETALSFNNLRGDLFGIGLVGSVEVDLTTSWCEIWLQTPEELDVVQFDQLLPPYVVFPRIEGVCRVTVQGRGKLTDSTYRATALLYFKRLTYDATWHIEDVTLTVSATSGKPVGFQSTAFRLAGGEWAVDGTVGRDEQGRWQISGVAEARGVDVRELTARALPDHQAAASVEGKMDAHIAYNFTIGPSGAEPVRGSLRLTSKRLKSGGLTFEDLVASGGFQGRTVEITRWGALITELGPARGTLSYSSGSPHIPITVALTSVDLGRLTGAEGHQPACVGVARANLKGHIRCSDGQIQLKGAASSDGLQFVGFPRTGPARAIVDLEGRQLTIRDFVAEAWGGVLLGRFSRELRSRAPSEIFVQIRNARLEDLLARESTGRSTFVSGIASGEGEILVEWAGERRVTRGKGRFVLEQARLGRLPVRNARGSIYFDGAGYDIVFTSMLIGDGTANGILTVIPGDARRFEASFAFRDISLPFVLVNLTGTTDPVAGRITGSLELRGTLGDWRNVDGVIYITRLRDADLWRLPVFDAVAELLLPGVARPGVFHDGRGRIAIEKGVAVVDGFALSGAAAQIYVRRGRIWPDGRIELELIGNAETLIPARAPLIGVVRRFADTVQHRLVRFYVTGTLQQPRVRALPLADVSGPAIELFRSLIRGPQ